MPQWNCSCPNCQAARKGLIPSRTQSCVAISVHPDQWFLINASPDLSLQISQFADLQPRARPFRNSPLAGVLLTNSDLDHLLGLYLLREGAALDVYATAAVRATAENELGLETVLNSFCGSKWIEPPMKDFSSLGRSDGGILYRAIELPGAPPLFANKNQPPERGVGHSVAYQMMDARTGGRLLVAPDVAEITPQLSQALSASDLVLFDGTFWSPEELSAVRPGARQAGDMGHVTIRDGSLKLLAALPARAKVYIHINNTNPILASDSPERKAVEGAGITVGRDGLEFEL